MAGQEDIVLSLGFDLSSVSESISTVQTILKNQKLIANIAYQFGSSQAQVRQQFKGFLDTLNADAKSNPIELKVGSEDVIKTLPRLRYALYDIASGTRAISDSLLAVGVDAVNVAKEYESAFTNVQRVTGLQSGTDEAIGLRKELKALGEQIPITFQEITQIATLGSQLGIADNSLVAFTSTVSKFSTVAGISVTDSAAAFGSLGGLLNVGASQYENLSSAIIEVGYNSRATEKEIVTLAEKLAASATRAGFTADEVIGLAGAFASLRIAPERAQGVLEVYFNTLNKAISDNGPRLQAFANIAGVSADEVANLVKNNPKDFFREFAIGLGSLDGESFTQATDALGLSGIRANEVFGRLAGGIDEFDKAIANSARAFPEATAATDAFDVKVDDLASKIQFLDTAIKNLGDSVANNLLGPFGFIVDAVRNFVVGVDQFAKTPLGGIIFSIVVALAALIGAFISLVTVTLTAAAGITATVVAISLLKGSVPGAAGSAITLTGVLTGLGLSARGAAVSLGLLRVALALTGIGLIISVITAFAGASYLAGDAAKTAAGGIDELTNAEGKTQAEIDSANAIIDEQNARLAEMQKQANGAAKKIRTLGDYAKDLSSIFKRSFEIRFGPQSALDKISSSFAEIAKSTSDARDEIRGLDADLSQLTADKTTTEYFLRIATSFGNTVNAAQLQAQLDKINADILKKNDELAAAQEKTNRTLTGNSSAAISNRATILGLVQEYQGYIEALASSGLSQEELSAKSVQLEQDFITQVGQLGFNIAELGDYTIAFEEVTKAIDLVPRDITATLNIAGMSAVDIALAEFVAKSTQAGEDARNGLESKFQERIPDLVVPVDIPPTQKTVDFWSYLFGRKTNEVSRDRKFSRSGFGSFSGANGGYTGAGGKYDVAGIVHKGEYVVPKSEVNQTTQKPYFMDQVPKFYSGGFVGGASPSPSSMMVELSPTDRMLLAQAGNVQLSIDGRVIAGATNGANNVYAQRGTN